MSGDKDNVSGLSIAIRAGIDSAKKEIHTALPVIIDSFDAETQLAAVQPAIQRIFLTTTADGETPEAVDLPQLINVPVIFPNAGGFALTFPVKKGDNCLLVFCERSIDLWHEYGGVQRPGARRFHALSDAVAIIGLNDKAGKLASYSEDNVELRNADGTAIVSIDPDGNIEVTSTESSGIITLKANNIKLEGDVEIEGNLVVSGTMENAGVNVGSTHFHTQGPDSDGNAQVPTDPPQ